MTEAAGEPDGASTRRMQASLRRAVGEIAHGRWPISEHTPGRLLAVLCGSTVTPLVTAAVALGGMPGAELTAASGIVSSVGAGIFSGMLMDAVTRFRAGSEATELRESAVERQLTDVIEAALTGGADPQLLAGEIAGLFRRINAGEIAVRVLAGAGNEAVFGELISALAHLDERMSDVRDVLLDDMYQSIGSQLGEIGKSQAQQRQDILELSVEVTEFRESFGEFRKVFDEIFERADAVAPSSRPPARGHSRWARACPYPGLRSFDEFGSPVFYGREDMACRLADHLAERSDDGPVIVWGASGAGKTSLLKAGLAPLLRAGHPIAGSERWPRLSITPGNDPLGALAWAIASLDDHDWKQVRALLAAEPTQANAFLQQAVDRNMLRRGQTAGDGRAVLMVDQFEEVFGSRLDGIQVRDFIRALHAIAAVPVRSGGQPPALTVIAVRGDFLDRCADAGYPELKAAIDRGMFSVTPMDDGQLRRAITGPAATAGRSFEDGLVDLILDDARAARRSGVLPLLSEAMRLTWEGSVGGHLTRHDYLASGGVAGAIQHSAEEVFTSLTAAQKALTRDILLTMTSVTREDQPTGRPVTRAEISDIYPGSDAELVLDGFARRRLIVMDDTSAQIAHDALLTAWPRLRAWLDGDRQGIILHRQLADDATRWRDHRGAADYLYRGAQLGFLQQAMSGWPTGRHPLTPDQRAFLDASKRAAVRARRRRGGWISGLAALTAIAVTVAVAAWRANTDAVRQRQIALSGQLAVLSENLDGQNPVAAAQLAAAAWQEAPTAVARESTLEVLAQRVRAVLSQQGPIAAAVFSPGHGRVLVTAGRTLVFWNLATHRPFARPLTVPGTARGAAFSPSGTILATAGGDGTVRLWHVPGGRAAGPVIAVSSHGVNAVAFSPDSGVLATADDDGTARLWDTSTYREIGRPLSASGQAGEPVTDVAFSPDGKVLATTSDDGTARLWDTATRRQIGQPIASSSAPYGTPRQMTAAVFSPHGNILATMDRWGTVTLRDVRTRHRIGKPISAQGADGDVTFSPDGNTLAVAQANGAVEFWDAATGTLIPSALTAATAAGAMMTVAFSPDGTKLATVSKNGTAWLWDLTGFRNTTPPRLIGHVLAVTRNGRTAAALDPEGELRIRNLVSGRETGPPLPVQGVSAAAFSPSGSILATGDDNGYLRLWSTLTGKPIGAAITASETGGVSAVTFSPSGGTLATGDDNGHVQLWNARTGRPAETPPPRLPDTVTSVVFSPDARTLAIADHDGHLRLWNRAARKLAPDPVTVPVDGVAFSPDRHTMATADHDGTARLWDLGTGHQIGESMGASLYGNASAVGFSPDGTLLVTAGFGDGIARLWDVATQRNIGVGMRGGTTIGDGIIMAAFTSSGSDIVTASVGGIAAQWNVTFPRDLLRAVCSIASRPMTRQEWSTYAPSAAFISSCS